MFLGLHSSVFRWLGLQPIKPGTAQSGLWAFMWSRLPLRNVLIPILQAGNRGSERVSPIPKAAQQDMAKLQPQPGPVCLLPELQGSPGFLLLVLSIQGQRGTRGGPWASEATAWGWRDKGLCLAGSWRWPASKNRKDGPMSQGEERTGWQGVVLEDGHLRAECISARFPPQPHVATQEGG